MGFRMYVNTKDESIEFPKFYGYADEKHVKQSWDFLKQDCEYDDMYIGNCYGPVKLDSKSFAEFIDIYLDEYCHWASVDIDNDNDNDWIEHLRNKMKEIIKSGKDVTLDWY